MREQLNSNPLVQVAVIGVLLLAVGIFVLTSAGGGGEESESSGSAPSPGQVTATVNGVPGSGATPGDAVENAVESLEAGAPAAASVTPSELPGASRPVPAPVLSAWKANQTVALLFVHDGGIDDDLVKLASTRLAGMPGVRTFVIPAGQISRYAAITEPVGVDRVPALVVLRPRHLDEAVPTASVSYGFQSGESVVQAVIDAGYKGPTVQYHP
ncbi:MAG TPA: hypothetical protein VHA54_10300 [Solirubrobacterales bacterium]|nr:hypothetical protein [Solirubrobacterales bacterium]